MPTFRPIHLDPYWRPRLRFAALANCKLKPAVSFAILLALACTDRVPMFAPPEDRFFWPTGIAVRHVDASGAASDCVPTEPALDGTCRTQLFVVSSNLDLRYDVRMGGTLLAIDVDRAIEDQKIPSDLSPPPLSEAAILGSLRIGSFGGQVAIVDSVSCNGWTGAPQALVASRSLNRLQRITIGSPGGEDFLRCDENCAVALDTVASEVIPSVGDPYGITVACGQFPAAGPYPSSGGSPTPGTPVPSQLAFVSHLRSVMPSGHSAGVLSRVDLGRSSEVTLVDTGLVPTHATVFDPVSTRLYFTSVFSAARYSPLGWVTLATPAAPLEPPWNMAEIVRGAEVRGMVLSTDKTRAYLAIRLFDEYYAAVTGYRPTTDAGGALAVMDLTQQPDGRPSGRILDVIPLERGAAEIRIVGRGAAGAAKRDLVAIVGSDDASLTLYDDETGAIARTITLCDPGTVAGTVTGRVDPPVPSCAAGTPQLGARPFGLAVQPYRLAGGADAARIFVGSMDRGWVNVITIDPNDPSADPREWYRLGPERK